MATFKYSIPSDEKDKHFQKTFLNSRIDLCKLNEGVRGNFVANMIMENFYKSADFVFQCPLKAGNYHAWNYKMSGDSFPSYLLAKDLKFLAISSLTAKIPTKKTAVPFFNCKFQGELIK